MADIIVFYSDNILLGEFPQSSEIQTKCFVTRTLKLIRDKPEAAWFTSHPQFRHFFHMLDEDNLKLQGMWMLLLRTICTPEDDVAWFAVNGVPIRYSMREHALISGLNCGDYPPNYEKLGDIYNYRSFIKKNHRNYKCT
ncbi:hypothetical protein BRARA_I03812 [Brassica rapa]|uniref:DUF1985 domain-containing protein n=1 Tax=Brassica campestris TaxID=3711 RepID=A0A397YBD1_BRACM|nr:hypothetical protein BRARA_I03812 [Brassica rapa]